MARRNKPEKHFRLKPYLLNWIKAIAKMSKATETSVVEDALEKGLAWRIKMIRKELDPNFLKEKEQAQVQQDYISKDELAGSYGFKNWEELDKVIKTKWLSDD